MGLAVKYERGDGSVTISMWGQQPAAGGYCCTKRLVAMTVARAARHGAVKTQRNVRLQEPAFSHEVSLLAAYWSFLEPENPS